MLVPTSAGMVVSLMLDTTSLSTHFLRVNLVIYVSEYRLKLDAFRSLLHRLVHFLPQLAC